MPYKSKRTRDLQGEVKAGSGISVTEQTKPDGTKEYTITNGDPASAITVDGTGLSLINNVLRNTMAAIMGWSGDDSRGAINWTDDNGDTVLKIIPLEELFIGDAHDNNDFIIKHINGANRLIRGTLQIAEGINSTEGVSLNTLVGNVQTLADMSNSAAVYEITTDSTSEDGRVYMFTTGFSALIESIGNFFTPINTLYIIGNTPVVGLKVLKGGIYKIDVAFQVDIASTTTPTESNLIVSVLTVDEGGNYEAIETENYFYPAPDVANEKYTTEITINTLIEVKGNEAICIVVDIDNSNMDTDIRTLGTDPRFSIQKIR